MKKRQCAALYCFCLFLVLLTMWKSSPSPVFANESAKLLPSNSSTGKFIIKADSDSAHCQEITIEENQMSQTFDSQKEVLQPITFPNLQSNGGLNIIMMGTSRLDNFPEAKTGFIRAAAIWESIIKVPITIIINVDFGPTRFGRPFPSSTLGNATSQSIGSSNIFPRVRQALIDSEPLGNPLSNLYSVLPFNHLLTDVGPTAAVSAPSAIFRALKIISSSANPNKETSLGDLPSIGFNSNFEFDFEPRDGIEPGKFDFEALAVHEIGHVLGFISSVGALEIDSSQPIPKPSIWDIFRFRPEINLMTFGSAHRIQSSGGEQVFFANSSAIPLSTGRPDSSGGDGAQASHWKATRFVGTRIGIMDPFFNRGERAELTGNDILAIDTFGYTVTPPVPDFRLGFNIANIVVQRGQRHTINVLIARINKFSESVTIMAPNVAKTTITPGRISTTSDSVSFTFQIKKKAPVGQQQVTFSGVDNNGRVRSATIILTIQ